MTSRAERLAEDYGFHPAVRPDRDESRFSFVGSTHLGFVEARHELHRMPDDATLLREFASDLATCKQWVLEAMRRHEERTIVIDRITIRPIVEEAGDVIVESGGDDSWPPVADGALGTAAPITDQERAIMEHDADLRSWPVLDEEPDV